MEVAENEHQEVLSNQSPSRNEYEIEDEDETRVQVDPNLPTQLKLLYAFNGATEGLPTLAFTAMINDRIQLPLSVIPAYYAIEFLPYSLKPLYAIATNVITSASARTSTCERNILNKDGLLIVLLITSAIMIAFTAFLKEGQVVQCFIIAFARGVFISWAEFLVGLKMILSARLLGMAGLRFEGIHTTRTINSNRGEVLDTDKRKRQQKQEELLSSFQSQAASARNFGSLFAHLVTFGILLKWKHENDDDGSNSNGSGESQMSDDLVNFMLMITSLFPIAAAFVAIRYRVYRGEASSYNDDSDDNDSTCTRHRPNTPSLGLFQGFMKYDMISLLLFQVLLVLIGLKQVIVDGTSDTFFNIVLIVVAVTLFFILLCSNLCSRDKSRSTSRIHQLSRYLPANNTETDVPVRSNSHLVYVKRVALYLILRHSTPSSGAMLSSYTYTKFRSRPLLLQTVSLLGSIVALLSSWTYGKRIAKKYSSLGGLKRVITVATVASSLWSLLSILFIRAFREQNGDGIPDGMLFLGLYAAYQLSEGFLGELSFLPSVILATTSTAYEPTATTAAEDGENGGPPLDGEHETNQGLDEDLERDVFRDSTVDEGGDFRLDDGLQYGLLIACIDFGDQLSGFVSMPIVQALSINRSNDWKNFEWFVIICALLSIASLRFLKILRTGSKSK